jgi:hypothetical protein
MRPHRDERRRFWKRRRHPISRISPEAQVSVKRAPHPHGSVHVPPAVRSSALSHSRMRKSRMTGTSSDSFESARFPPLVLRTRTVVGVSPGTNILQKRDNSGTQLGAMAEWLGMGLQRVPYEGSNSLARLYLMRYHTRIPWNTKRSEGSATSESPRWPFDFATRATSPTERRRSCGLQAPD